MVAQRLLAIVYWLERIYGQLVEININLKECRECEEEEYDERYES